ncbi:hypothetical protein GIB67_035265 [Kingdonia uniflora]|uniref:Zinc finger PMZ-type domain-containing protein n=1 Tax=Kingdonia uniflora TaxID=39325 RepID=A0A7J7KY43_9MAGN|nr:hypothetical protein GIB67_035265 [Kingdonia uniflora]
MNGVQLYTIVHFGGDIVRLKIRSIVTYVGGSKKLTSLKAHSSYEDFVILLEETSEIRREDCKLYNFVHGCACAISSVQDFTVMINMHKTNPVTPFHIWIVNDLRVPSQNSQNFISNFYSLGKGLSTTKDTGSGRGLSTTKAGGPLRHNSFPDPEPKYRGYPEKMAEGLIRAAEFQFEPQPEQVKDLLDFRFKSTAYTKDPYDFSKEFNIGDLYRDRIKLKNHIRAYAVVIKFNLEHVLSNEYKIVIRGNFEYTYQLLTSYFTEVRLADPDFVFDIQTMSCKDKRFTRYGVAYTNNVESWNNVILKVRDLPIHVFIEELRRICSEMSYTYSEEDEKSQARLTSWATDHCESKKFVADSLTCRVRTSRHHFQMTSYGRTGSIIIEDCTCSCRWWQTMGIPYEHRVRTLGLANVDPTTRVSEYYTNNTYKVVYEPIWIPIRGIEQWKILKTNPRVHAPIPTVRASYPRTQRKRREKMSGLVTKLRFCSRCRKNGHNRCS